MEDLKPLAEAADFEEHKALREAKRKAASEPAAEVQAPPTPASETAPSEIAADSEPAKPKTQEKEEKPRSLESRIAKLRADGKHGEADSILRKTWEKDTGDRFEKLERELQEYRTRKPAIEPQPAAAASQAAPPSNTDDGGPKASDYDGSAEGKRYEDYLVDRATWKLEQKNRAEETRKANETKQQTFQRRHGEVLAARADFNDVAGKVNLQLSNEQAARFFEGVDNWGEVLYNLGSNPAEVEKLISMPGESRLMQLAIIGHTLKTPAAGRSDAPPPEKLKPAVSRAPAPGRNLGGIEPPPVASLSEAAQGGYEQFRNRHGVSRFAAKNRQ